MTKLISLTHLKTYYEVRPGYTGADDKLNGLIESASSLIETFCRRSFATAVRTEYFNSTRTARSGYDFSGDGESGIVTLAEPTVLDLAGMPVDDGETFTIKYSLSRDFANTTEIASTYYFLDATAGQVILKFPMYEGHKTIQVSYTAGYTVDADGVLENVPADLKHACVLQVIYMMNRAHPDNVGVVYDRDEGTTNASKMVQPVAGLLPDAAQICSRYRRLLKGLY